MAASCQAASEPADSVDSTVQRRPWRNPFRTSEAERPAWRPGRAPSRELAALFRSPSVGVGLPILERADEHPMGSVALAPAANRTAGDRGERQVGPVNSRTRLLEARTHNKAPPAIGGESRAIAAPQDFVGSHERGVHAGIGVSVREIGRAHV